MKISDVTTPVVILNCKLGALGIARSLGSLGVPIYGVDADAKSPGMVSRYCGKKYYKDLDEQNPDEYLDLLLKIGNEIGKPSVLIWTSDETAVFVAENADRLSRHFVFPENEHLTIKRLMHKKEMFLMARELNVPTATTEFPQNLEDVTEYSERAAYPVMLKGILGNRLQERTGKKMVVVESKNELIENYKQLEDPETPNLMLQEYIPGGDDQVYIFNGYFDAKSECLAAFTGHKIRQFPVHVGCASLGACTWNQDVADLTIKFMKDVGYSGILDIGYRLDPRNGQYKVLDINPRIGQAFRLFLGENGMDVARSLYLDLTRQEQYTVVPREGRRWLIEDFDVISTFHYFQEGSLCFGEWVRSFKGVEEAAWFSLKDPRPFFMMLGELLKRAFTWFGKKTGFIQNSRTINQKEFKEADT